jgi:SAM-dependent methyltransferase
MNSSIFIFKSVFNGKSIYRALQNQRLMQIKVSGKGIDLGAKSEKSSYYKFLQIAPNTQITFTDLYSEGPNIIKIDLESPFEIDDNSQDFLILMNVIEHLYNYENCTREACRILKPGHRLIGVVPFMHKIHPDPDDFFRYSESSLNRIFKNAGFSDIKIESLSIGPFTTSYSLIMPLIPLRVFKAFFALVCVNIDHIIRFFIKKNHPSVDKNMFPLGYYFECTK